MSTVVLLPDGQSRWVLPKLTVLALAIAMGALTRPGGRLPRWFAVILVCSAAVLVAATLASAAPWAQAWGRWPRYEGLVALPVYAGAIWLGARVLGPRHRVSGMDTLRQWAAIVAVALGLLSIVEAAGFRPLPSDISRPGSLTGTATDQGILGAILVAVLFTSVVRFVHSRASTPRALLAYAGMGFAVASIVLSASRGALVAAIAALIVTVACEAVAARRRPTGAVGPGPRFVVASGAIALLAAAVGAVGTPLTRARLLGGGGLAAPGLSDRRLIWGESLRVVGDHPWFGVGPSGFVDAVPPAHRADWYAANAPGVVLDSPHSGYLQLLVAGGLPLFLLGVGALVAIAIVVVRAWSTSTRSATAASRADAELFAMAAAAVAALCAGLVTSFTSVAIVAIPALLAGAAIALPAGVAGREPRTSRSRRRLLGGVLAAWTVFLGVSTSAEVSLAGAEDAAGRGDLVATLASLNEAQGRRPWDADVTLIGAEILTAAADRGVAGASDPAVEWARRALARLPDSLEGAMALAIADTVRAAAGSPGDLTDAEAILRRLAGRVPLDASVAHRLAAVLIYQGRLPEARNELVRASELAPDDRNILLTLAYVYGELGDTAAAAGVKARMDALPAPSESAP